MLRKLAYIPLLAAILVPAVGHALGLGEIRVSSALNQPLDAEVTLTAVGSGELDTLEVRLASAESFERVGLDRPFVLTQLRFEVGQDDNGRPVIKVTTRENIREPFLSFLIEATWSRGRLVREYTVLLDPPVLMPATAEPVRPAETRSPATTADRAPAPTRTRPSDRIPEDRMYAGPGTYGPIQRGEVLWSIAESTRPSSDITVSQMMLALFDANPDAFMGNINRMKAGYILRVPDSGTIRARSVAEANYEVARHNDAWRSGQSTDFRVTQAGPAAGDDRLRLRAPGEARGTDPAGTGSGNAELERQLADARAEVDDERAAREALATRLAELESETAELRRQLEIRDAELEALTGRERAPAETAEEEPEVVTEAPVTEAEKPEPVVEDVVEEETTSPLDMLTNPLVLALLIGVPILGVLAFVALRRRRAASEANKAIGGVDSDEDSAATQLGASDETVSRDEDDAAADADKTQIASSEAADEPEAEPAADEMTDDEAASSGVMRLDDSDPTSEADFHLAYGLYDQAADLMEGAVQQQPDNVPYRMKLLEIYFAWGKPDEFIKVAREGQTQLQGAGEWMNVAILGRQLSADEPLFSDTGGGESRSGVDLDIAGGGGDDGGVSTDMDADEFGFSDAGSGEVEEAMDTVEPESGEPAPEAEPEQKDDSGDLEFDLSDFDAPAAEEDAPAADDDSSDAGETISMDTPDGLDMPLDDEPAAEQAPDTAEPAAEGTTSESGDDGMDLDLGALDEPAADDSAGDDDSALDLDDALAGLEAEGSSDEVEAGFSDESSGETGDADSSADDLSLDFDSLLDDSGDSDGDSGSGDGESDGGSRLDLARAYIDMGDTDGARTLLEEVVESGDDDQKREAQELLNQLG